MPVNRPLVRGLLVAAALGMLAAGALHYRSLTAQKATLVSLAERSGIEDRHPGVLGELAREPDPGIARLHFARALLADEIDMRWMGGMEPAAVTATLAGSLDRLALARDLAAAELRERPGSWQAAMVLGGATYVGWSRQRDKRLFNERAAWEEPMRAAVAWAPGNPEPRRLLGAAYLETWYSLPPERRDEARDLLRTAFEDLPTFERLIEPWLDLARDPVVAFSIMPAQPAAWVRLQRFFADRRDWERYGEARAGWERELRSSLVAQLDEADRHLEGGETRTAKALYFRAAAEIPADLRYADLFVRALGRCPPGPADRVALPSLERWLELALDLYAHRLEPLPPAIVDRLAGAGNIGAAERALAAVAAGRLPAAELYERRSGGALRAEAWGPYTIAKARALTARQELPAAKEALASTHRTWRSTAGYWLATEELALASKSEADRSRAAAQLATYRREVWSPTAWRWRGPQARLELFSARPAESLVVAVDVGDAAGSAVEIYWDGRSLGVFDAYPGGTIRLLATASAGLHLLALETVAGARVVPGTVWLEPTG